MSLGISLLCKLGLTQEEAINIKEQENVTYVFARDQGGIGYTTPKLSALPDLDSTFARLAALSSFGLDEAPKIEIKPIKNRYFVPNKLKKKDVNSLSNEDLSSIFIQSNSMADQLENISNNFESPRKKRHHRHHHQAEEEEQNSPYNDQIESPVADDLQNAKSDNQAITENLCASKEANIDNSQSDASGNNTEKKRRRRRHRNKMNNQIDGDNNS